MFLLEKHELASPVSINQAGIKILEVLLVLKPCLFEKIDLKSLKKNPSMILKTA